MIVSPPSDAALAWAAEAVGGRPGSASTVRRLAGGAHAATHLLRIGAADLVLRRFPAGDAAAVQEALVLRGLDGLDGWAPRLVAADPDGSRTGSPAVLISRLRGRADITPRDPHAAAALLGAALARVHAVPLSRLPALRDAMAAPNTAQRPAPDAGPAGPPVAAGRHRLAAQPPVLTHFDFWTGNVLWTGPELTGVVDWSGACRAPRGFDVSWCRLDLAVLHGPDVAGSFLAAYQRAAGTTVADLALWDLFALANSHRSVETWLPNYHDLGRIDLTTADLRARHTAWTTHRLAAH
ncbi:phosphotransferase family protein [Kitasatospora sp. NPDC048365]|uniref:phosphotransferase family protein n=1 Tax=Kitasatospora sp. NPDC048365 TaxID=3364050 RepID=UPI0037174077